VRAFFLLNQRHNFWDVINSPFFVTVVLGLLGLTIQRRIRNDIEAAPEVRKAIAASREKSIETQEQIDAIIEDSQEAGADVVDLRGRATEIVQELKNAINSLIANDPDKRHHRVYERLGRGDYKILVEALFERGQLGFRAAAALNTALTGWDAYARGRAAKKAVPQPVIDLLNQAKATL
jgi:hypothetical protein